MEEYLRIVKKILNEGHHKENRTGVDTYAVAGEMFEHDMANGFPLLTTKRVPFKAVRSELEFFIKGMTNKEWLQEQKNPIWNEWCCPDVVPYGHDEETKQKMMAERDLGPIYGFQWRHFGAEYGGPDHDHAGEGVDQLEKIVDKLKTDPNDRRMIVSAWNPAAIQSMALPPCHYGFQVTVIDDKLNLLWNQRSVDTMLGLPFNIAGYATLLHLLAKESGFGEGKLIGFLGDVHLYENHEEGIKEQLSREPRELPRVETVEFTSIFDWNYQDTKLIGYKPHPKIAFEIAV
ncbi:thymidylate synthase [Candidatus Woesearchaeota archaeon]|nr:thymidylate synthase [Candidatus Woesearchaeota archaeon]